MKKIIFAAIAICLMAGCKQATTNKCVPCYLMNRFEIACPGCDTTYLPTYPLTPSGVEACATNPSGQNWVPSGGTPVSYFPKPNLQAVNILGTQYYIYTVEIQSNDSVQIAYPSSNDSARCYPLYCPGQN